MFQIGIFNLDHQAFVIFIVALKVFILRRDSHMTDFPNFQLLIFFVVAESLDIERGDCLHLLGIDDLKESLCTIFQLN